MDIPALLEFSTTRSSAPASAVAPLAAALISAPVETIPLLKVAFPASDISTYAGGGKVLQIQSAKIASATSVTSTTATATNLTDAITPSASDSKILVIVDCIIGMSEGSGTGNVGQIQLFRDIGGAGFSNIYRAQDNASISISGLDAGTNVSSANQVSMVFLDSPSTTSACTYTQYIRLNVASASGDSINSGPSSLDSTMTLIEIGA